MTDIEIDEQLAEFVRSQSVFWVASAPLSGDGHVNVSPKGFRGTFGFISGQSFSLCCPHIPASVSRYAPRAAQLFDEQVLGYFAYVDIGGSGIETVAHLQENGRITIMFSAFEGPPRIVRLFGRGAVLEPGQGGWDAIVHELDPSGEAVRQFHADTASAAKPRNLVVVAVLRCRRSCGYGVPLLEHRGYRDTFPQRFAEWTVDALEARRAAVNVHSLDNLPGLPRLQHAAPSPFLSPPSVHALPSLSDHRAQPASPPSRLALPLAFLAGALFAVAATAAWQARLKPALSR